MRKAAVTVRLPGDRMTPGKSVSIFAKVGALKATAKTEITCIISADGVGMGFSFGRFGFVTSTLPQVPLLPYPFSKKAKVQLFMVATRLIYSMSIFGNRPAFLLNISRYVLPPIGEDIPP